MRAMIQWYLAELERNAKAAKIADCTHSWLC